MDQREDIDRQLDELLAAAMRMSELSLVEVRWRWEAESEYKRRLTWRRVKRALLRTRRSRLLDDFRGRVLAWMRDLPSVETGGPTGAGFAWAGSAATMSAIELRAAVGPALLDAAAAVIVGDCLDAADRLLLRRPFLHDRSLVV